MAIGRQNLLADSGLIAGFGEISVTKRLCAGGLPFPAES